MLFTVFYYVLMASYMWIFVEGLHLHTLIMVSVFSERSSVKWYLCIGWGEHPFPGFLFFRGLLLLLLFFLLFFLGGGVVF